MAAVDHLCSHAAPPRSPGPLLPLQPPAVDHASSTCDSSRAAKKSPDHAGKRSRKRLFSALGQHALAISSRRCSAIRKVGRAGKVDSDQTSSRPRRQRPMEDLGITFGALLHAALANSGFWPLLSALFCVSLLRSRKGSPFYSTLTIEMPRSHANRYLYQTCTGPGPFVCVSQPVGPAVPCAFRCGSDTRVLRRRLVRLPGVEGPPEAHPSRVQPPPQIF